MKKTIFKTLCIAWIFVLSGTFYSCSSEQGTNHKDNHSGHTGHGEVEEETLEVKEVSAENLKEEAKAHFSELLKNYFQIKDALVVANTEDANVAAEAIQKYIQEFGVEVLDNTQKKTYDSQIEMIKTHSQKIASTDDIEAQRKEFRMLSIHLYKLITSLGAKEIIVYKQFCPMAFDDEGAFWLSDTDEVFNPYFGDKMLRCGIVQEQIAIQ